MRRIDYIVVHSSATPAGVYFDASDIDDWHRQRGWSQIGYNFVVLLDGTVEEGRPLELVPAHVKSHNRNSIGIVYIGGTDKYKEAKDTRTFKQKRALKKLLKQLKEQFPDASIVGHRDLAKPGKTQCPSFDATTTYRRI